MALQAINVDDCPIESRYDGDDWYGIDFDVWGRPTTYYFYPPGQRNKQYSMIVDRSKLVAVPAQYVTHIKLHKRWRQARGMSLFATIVDRIVDYGEVESFDMAATKVASALALVIERDKESKGLTKLGEEVATDGSEVTPRELSFTHGMLFDTLAGGEKMKPLPMERPNNKIPEWRKDQFRSIASGSMTAYGQISQTYDKSFSAQRQANVDIKPIYEKLTGAFISRKARPVWKLITQTALLLRRPNGKPYIDPRLLRTVATPLEAAAYVGPYFATLEPHQDIKTAVMEVQAGLDSLTHQTIKRGRDPADVIREKASEQVDHEAQDLVLSSNFKHSAKSTETETNDDGETEETE